MDALEGSLKQISVNGSNPFDGPKAAAVSALARYLSEAALNGYRQKRLREAIALGHQHLDEIVDGLALIVEDYTAILRNERQNVVTNQAIIIAQRNKGGNTSALDEQMFETKQHIGVIETKERAAGDYKIILARIAEVHNKLYISSQSDQLDSALMVEEISNYAADLTPLINRTRIAFAQ